eukprot:12885382-Prorocentrum_lima.AAC.1
METREGVGGVLRGTAMVAVACPAKVTLTDKAEVREIPAVGTSYKIRIPRTPDVSRNESKLGKNTRESQ